MIWVAIVILGVFVMGMLWAVNELSELEDDDEQQ